VSLVVSRPTSAINCSEKLVAEMACYLSSITLNSAIHYSSLTPEFKTV